MYKLAFDTTANACSIALAKDDAIIDKFFKVMEFGQSETLIPAIKDMLDKQNIQICDLEAIGVCVGPGSFTGVRSSISAAKAFGVACKNVKILGVNSFEAYTKELIAEELADINTVIIETRREDFYYQLFDKKLNKLTSPSAGSYEDIIPQLRHKKVTLIGDGVERFLSSPSGLSLHCLKMLNNLSIENIVTAIDEQLDNKRYNFPKPLYLRAPIVFCAKK